MLRPSSPERRPGPADLANALSILDAMDALVYVADMDTHEILFANRGACRDMGQDLVGKICWQAIQKDQNGPCPFCTNHLLRDADGKPTPAHTWEFRNTRNGRWYHLVDQAMTWTDGRLVRLEIATDITARKQAEEEIKAKNKFLNSIFQTAPCPMVLVNRDARVADANYAAETLAGRKRASILGLLGGEVLRCLNASLPEGCGRTPACSNCPVRTQVMRTFASGEWVHHAEASLDALREGAPQRVHFLLSTGLVRLAGEDLVLLSLVDITERKTAEERIARSERKFRQVLERVPLIGISLDARGRLVFANDHFLSLAGWSREEALGRDWFETFIPPELRDEIRGIFSAAMASRGAGEYSAHEYDILTRDGRRLAIAWANALTTDSAGRVLDVTCLGVDTTERRRAEEALRDSEERFRSVAQATPLGIHFYELAPDASLVFTGANPAADKILRIRHADLVGLTMEQAFPAHRDSDLPVIYRRVAAHGDRFAAAGYAYEDRRVFGDFDVWAFQTSPGRMAAMFMDVSERKRSGEELLAAKLAAEEASRAKSEFLATMSHEIRTPLNGVMGMLQLAAGEDLPPEVRGYLDTALHSSRNLLRVLSDILDLSRIEAGAMAIEAAEFDLESVLTPVLEAFRPESQARGLSMEMAVDPATPRRLVGDAGRIRQVLFNLVGNAVKYTEDGHIRLEAYSLARFSRPGVAALHLVVADTGIGISDEQLSRAFEPFSQVDGSSTRRHGGSGLGLAIVRRLVGLMHGALAFCSELGKGTEAHLTLWLPLAADRPQPAAPAPAAPPAPTSTAGVRVLVVEDEPVNRLAVTRMLQKLDMVPVAAEGGGAALELLSLQPFDCVLMDIQMPEMDGLETTQHIREAKPGTWDPGIPVLALTAHAMKGDRERFLAAGMDGYLSKPVDLDELRQAIDQALAERRAGS
ncbi:MAG: PAS domain S-box protein [Thermodesulfobacteriota bacterium]